MRTLTHGQSPARHGRTKQLHLESGSGSGTAGDRGARAGSSPGLCKSGSDRCWGSRTTYIQHFQPVSGGFPPPAGPSLPGSLCSLLAAGMLGGMPQGRDALEQLPTGLTFLQGTLPLRGRVGSCSKRASPLLALRWGITNRSPRRPGQCQGAKHRVEEASYCRAGWVTPLLPADAGAAGRKVSAIRPQRQRCPEIARPDPGVSPTKRGPGRAAP